MSAGGEPEAGGRTARARGAADYHASIAGLVRVLGESARQPTRAELARLQRVLADQVLPSLADIRAGRGAGPYLLGKHLKHVVEAEEWPAGTSPAAYLGSLRTTVRNPRVGVRLYRDVDSGQWMVPFVARVRRDWAGPESGTHVVLVFNGERVLWVSGFQVRHGVEYSRRQGGWWLRSPG